MTTPEPSNLEAEVDALRRELTLTWESHLREHETHEKAHAKEHEAQSMAVAKAEAAVDRRLEGMNEVRSQLRDQAQTFAPMSMVSQLQAGIDRRFMDTTKHTDERYEENRRRIEVIEKGDVKQEGRSLGQGAVVAIIVGAIGLVGTVISIIVVLANLATTP